MRLIDADLLMKQVIRKKEEEAAKRYTEGFNDALMKVRSMIHSASTVQLNQSNEPIKVVLCGECIHYKRRATRFCGVCEYLDTNMSSTDYCSYGRKKEADE